jgi:hypothetical protein
VKLVTDPIALAPVDSAGREVTPTVPIALEPVGIAAASPTLPIVFAPVGRAATMLVLTLPFPRLSYQIGPFNLFLIRLQARLRLWGNCPLLKLLNWHEARSPEH